MSGTNNTRTRTKRTLTGVLLIVLALLAAGALAGKASALTKSESASTAPWIQSDQADYSPGSTVTLTGGNWQAGESVHIFVNDDAGQTWSRNVDVTAGTDGAIRDQFPLPASFVALYSVTATGAQSGTATTTFTDGNVTVQLTAAEGVSSMTVTYSTWDSSTTCSGTATTTGLTLTVTSGSTTNIPGFGGSGESVRFTSVSTPTSGKTFDRWTNGTKVGGNIVDTGTTTSGSPTPCISNSTGGTNGNLADIFGHFVASNSAPAIAATNATVTVNEGSPAANSGTWSDANAGDTVTLSASVGTVTPAGTNASGTWNWSYTPADGLVPAASQTVTITANDAHGGVTSTNFGLTVNNVTPNVTAPANQAATQGVSTSFNLGSFSDPGADSPWAVDINWGDGSAHANPTVTGAGAASNLTIPAQSHTYSTTVGSPFTVSVKVTDKDGGSDTKTFTVSVTEVRSTSTSLASSNNPSTFGQSVTFTATVTAVAGNPSGVGTVTFLADSVSITGCVAVSLTDNQAPCTTSALDAAGSPHSITAQYSGTSTGPLQFQGSTSAPLPQAVNKAVPTLSFTAISDQTFGAAPADLAASSNSPGAISFSVTSGPCSIASGKVSFDGAGTCVLAASVAETANYLSKSVSQTVQIAKAVPTVDITWSNSTFNGTANQASAVVKGVGGTALSGASATLTYYPGSDTTGTALSGAPTNAGTYTVLANFAGNTNYEPASNTKSIAIAQAAQAIIFAPLANKTLGDLDFTVSATGGGSGNSVTFASGTTPVCTVTVATVHIVTVGTCTVTASQLGNANYLAATPVSRSFNVNYVWEGFLQPINDTAHQTGLLESKFKLGQTIPVKFVLKNAAGAIIQQVGSPTFSRSGNLGSCDSATAVEPPDVILPDAGVLYVWDGNQYHYNWSTKGLTAGEYRIYANLADGTKPYVDICLN